MRAPKEPQSKSEPARAIGDHLHGDFIILKKVPASSNNPAITTPSKSSSPTLKISTKKKLVLQWSKQVVNQSDQQQEAC
jgi:hypothetical protein